VGADTKKVLFDFAENWNADGVCSSGMVVNFQTILLKIGRQIAVVLMQKLS
jgi:hypothetical protein